MDVRIDMPVQRSDAACSEPVSQFVQRLSARVTENEIEIAQSPGSDISEVPPALQFAERDGRIQVIEHADGRR